jgi:hypothetical protein
MLTVAASWKGQDSANLGRIGMQKLRSSQEKLFQRKGAKFAKEAKVLP